MNASRRCAQAAMLRAMAIAGACALTSGCQQKMADQPSYKPLDPSSYSATGGSAREPVAGTIARGYLFSDWALFTGRSVPDEPVTVQGANAATSLTAPKAVPTPASQTPPATGTVPAPARTVIDAELADYKDTIDEFPIPITEQVVEHGRDRFMIYCVVCHDAAGTGHGKIVERGYTRPPSYHIERLRKAPLGHFFRVITLGYGSMPSYASQISARDRWAIIAYIRALQWSQHFPEDQLPKDLRERFSAHEASADSRGSTP